MLRRLTCLLGLGPLVASAVAQNEAECSDGGYVNPCKGYAVDCKCSLLGKSTFKFHLTYDSRIGRLILPEHQLDRQLHLCWAI